jgi:hypothetical protein
MFTGRGIGHNVLYSFVWAAPTGFYGSDYTVAVPEMRLILLRVIALTAAAGAAFVITDVL